MKLTAVVASLALTAGLGTSAPLPAAEPPPEPAVVSEAGDKIDPELRQSFRQQPTAEFWIRFEDRADLDPALDIADWTERGQFVYDALTQTAESSLAGVAPQLEAAGVEYTSYPIANAVLVEGGTEGLALDLAENRQVAEVHETPQVELVEPVLPTTAEPAPRAAQAGPEWGLEYVNAPEAWERGATGAGITVSNLDSGVQFDHPALVASYRGARDDGTFDHDYNWFTTRGDCGSGPCDDNGHGTHTMGTMVGDDGAGNQVGVAPEAQWIATNGCCEESGFQTLLDSGWWLLAPTDLDGRNPDVSRRPHVVNNSWGSSAEHAFGDFFTAIDEAWTAAGMFAVWSAGNTSPAAACDTVSSPGAHPDAYSVGAFASNGVLGAFSRKGEGEGGVVKPEISAPGVNVRSSWPGGGYHAISGTSMAAPHVAGAVAALWSYDPTLVGQIARTRALLAESAVDVDDTSCGGTAQFNNKYGEGRLDLVRLLDLAPREGGTLTGLVTAGGEPLAGAEVSLAGPFDRTVGTGKDGSFTVHLPAGGYEVTVTAFGHLPATADATVAVGEDATVEIALEPADTHDVSGTLLDEDGRPVPGATVSVPGTPLDDVRTDDAGGFVLVAVPEGDYTLDVVPHACLARTTVPLAVEPATGPVEVRLDRVVDEGGYTCAVSEGEYRRGTDEVEFPSGVWAKVPLPSPIALYNGTHDTLGIGLRGTISVDDSWAGPGTGGAGVFPFYTQTPLRPGGDGSGVYTASTTVDGEDAFVVEYRDMVVWGGSDWPRESEGTVSFSTTFTRSGTVIVAYGDGVGGSDPLTAGLVATTGIQGWEGVDGIRFSERAPVLHDGLVVTYDLPDFGYVDTSVVDRNDGLPVEGATVAISDADGLVESLTTTSTGTLRRQLPVGDYTMTLSAPDYVTETHEFSLDELYAETAVDVRLATGVADLTGDGLDAVLGTGQHGTGSLTLTNPGSAPVTFELGEVARHPELDAGVVTARTGTGADSTIDTTAWDEAAASADHEASAGGDEAPGDVAKADVAKADDEIGTHSGGDVVARIVPEGDTDEKEPSGLGYDGDVWIHDYDARTNTAYTVSGERTGKEFDAAWNPDYRAFDMAFDTRTGDMCQLEDSPASLIHCFDRDTGAETRRIEGAWSNTQLTGLAYNETLDVFYVGGRGIGAIGTVAGTSHDTPGEFLSYCSPPLPEVMGLAYNAASDTLWYTDRAVNRPTRLLQVDPVDCSLVNAWWFPGERPMLGGGLATDASGALWATDQLADEVLLVDVEDPLLTDLPWLSLSTTGGTLAPGESLTVQVDLSSDDVEPGVLGANILVTSDAGRQSTEYVPVTLTTTAYQAAVNAGGGEFTDADGFTWSADQRFEDGAWGHQGRTREISTRAAVDGTTDDALFRSQRAARHRSMTYAFDDAPEGTYQVDLAFAEIQGARPGRRVFDVLVDDVLTRYAYDASGTVGRDTADWHTAVVEHDGGPLTVTFRGALGLRPPSVAAVRVTLDPRAVEAPAPEPEQPEPEEVPVAPAQRVYEVTETTGLYRQGTTNTGWSGRFGCGVLWFGFDLPFYDTAWDGVCVAKNGMLTFDRARSDTRNTALPTPRPADALYPFWDDLLVDDDAAIYVGVTTVDGLDAQIVEYRDVTFDDERTERVSFSVTLVEDGRIQVGYGDGVGGDNPRTAGSSATVGVESLDGIRATQYSFDEPVLTAGQGLEYVLPASGTVEGRVTDANDGEPVAGALVTLTSPEGGTRTITANAQGLWKAQALLGEHTVSVGSPRYETVDSTVTVARAGQAEVLDIALATGVAEVSGDELEWFLDQDRTATAEFTVTNTGSAPLAVELTEQRRDEQGGHEPGDLPWLSLDGAAADGGVDLAVGASTTVTVAVDNAGADPGLLVGDVLVTSDAGRDPRRYERARLATSAYWLGVDVGGRGLVGADGFEWSGDQALDANPDDWGHVGGIERATRAPIAGTEDDDLFRTQRTGKTFRYVFRDVPEGAYRIDLGMAETSLVPLGERSIDVLVDGEVVLYDHDVRAHVGAFTADRHTATVEHTGGDLTVELIGETGRRHPILSSLAVREDPRR